MRTRVKICGITRVEDGLAAARSGADAIGLVFYAPSPRYVDLQQAAAIAAALPPFVTRVGLFVNAEAQQVTATLSALSLDLMQFHGDEPADYCRSFAQPYLKAVRMRPDIDLAALMREHASASGFLLDAYQPGVAGGSGAVFDWRRVPQDCERPLVLAGGLDAENISAAIRATRPWGVDVSSGVEAAKGVKDPNRIAQFIRGVAGADAAISS